MNITNIIVLIFFCLCAVIVYVMVYFERVSDWIRKCPHHKRCPHYVDTHPVCTKYRGVFGDIYPGCYRRMEES